MLSKRNVLIAIFIACVAFTYSPLTLLGFPALIYLVVYIGMKRYYLPRFFGRAITLMESICLDFLYNRRWSIFYHWTTGKR